MKHADEFEASANPIQHVEFAQSWAETSYPIRFITAKPTCRKDNSPIVCWQMKPILLSLIAQGASINLLILCGAD